MPRHVLRISLAAIVLSAPAFTAAPARAATLYTTGINRSSQFIECRALNVGSKPVDVKIEVRAVTSPPPDFFSCATQTITIRPGRIEGVDVLGTDCGASGPYYCVFTTKGGKIRAWSSAFEDQGIRAEAH